MSKVAQLVFIPSLGAGHQVSTVEFARRLLYRENRLTITILNIPPPAFVKPATGNPNTNHDPSIQFIDLPMVDELPSQDFLKETPEKYITAYIDSYTNQIRDEITKPENNKVPIAALVVDMFCSSYVNLAKELNLPCYTFFSSGVAFLALMDYLPDHSAQVGRHFSLTDPDVVIPGYKNPFPASVIPPFLHRESGFVNFKDHALHFREMKGALANSFAELEDHALSSLRSRKFPPVYTVGPVLDLTGQAHSQRNKLAQHDRIMKWLNSQPMSSVIFLCFGSVGYMREAQVREVASGLLKSGARFLWALKKQGLPGMPADYTEEEKEELLPAEFWSAVEKGQGMLCGWAPQVEVLAHEAVAGFVTHCGWNSTLEALWFGRPMVTWPMYAEQNCNAFQLAKDMTLGVELRLAYDRDGEDLVTGDELERAIRCLMDHGNDMKRKAKETAEASRTALLEGGSSYNYIGQFIREVIGPYIKIEPYHGKE